MSLVIARDESTAQQIIFPWPDPLPWGAELVCKDDEVAIVCPNFQVGEQLGPGRHTISPPNPQSHILAYFVRTTAELVVFDRTVTVVDRQSNQTVPVSYEGKANIKVGDPTLMCHQLVGLPYHDLATGVLRSATNSLAKVFQHVITKVCMSSPSVSTIASPEAVAQLVQMAANANPMAIAVTGLELVNFEDFRLSVNGENPIEWMPGSLSGENVKTTPLLIGEHTGEVAINESSNTPPKTAKLHPVKGPTTAKLPAVTESKAPSARAASQPNNARQTGERAAVDDSQEQPLPAGSRVLVYGNDGLWHAATIQQYNNGRYQLTAEGGATPIWVPANQVRPA